MSLWPFTESKGTWTQGFVLAIAGAYYLSLTPAPRPPPPFEYKEYKMSRMVSPFVSGAFRSRTAEGGSLPSYTGTRLKLEGVWHRGQWDESWMVWQHRT
jgi:hypothetical protein